MENKKRRKWQRGTADMVSVGVGLVILGIVTAGTSAAMVYGREAMIRQEHYKAAAYRLRGHMEEAQGRLQYIAREDRDLTSYTWAAEPLDLQNERNNSRVDQVKLTCSQETVEPVFDMRLDDHRPLNGPPDYYVLTMHGRWRERDYAEQGIGRAGIDREITFKTAVVVRADIQ